ncbi:MAG: biotin--[acetyl-CoA-carboxylase] ligase [Tannerellaceae bacterium]|jgi:BirA family biotin operon repressor/biotin-[acetyl-CoA-carboxylase] ligase|nr:biotin--[acetyl-CoA-carboxylase] ligase [Tannerellaceae bacterium]
MHPQIIRLKEIPSTNRYLRERIRDERLPEGSLVIAESQTAGRGQPGTRWESEPGKNLTFSLLLYPDCLPVNRQFLLSQITALAVKETLDAYTGDISVKWPNDVYWQNKKICGILIENNLSGSQLHSSIIGVGLNLNQMQFGSDAPNPVSLRQITGEECNPEEILDRFLQNFFRYYLLLLQEKEEMIRNAYKSVLFRKEGFFTYCDAEGEFEARILDIAPQGHLILQVRSGETRRYAFKEVSYKNEPAGAQALPSRSGE